MNALFINIRKSLLTTLLGGVSLVSLANGNGPVSGGNSANTAEVKYVTRQQGEGVFNVSYNNAAGNRFSLVVLDADGDQLYSYVYSEKNFEKNFKLADPENFRKLIFIIRNLDDHTTQRFEVEATGHEEEQVEVTELN
jgi:hypothetical protein